MKIKLVSWNETRDRILKDPAVKAEYDRLAFDPEFAVLEAMVAAQKSGITQKEIAKKMGTTQSAVSRLKSGNVSPTIDFLNRFASAIGQRMEISFKPIAKSR